MIHFRWRIILSGIKRDNFNVWSILVKCFHRLHLAVDVQLSNSFEPCRSTERQVHLTLEWSLCDWCIPLLYQVPNKIMTAPAATCSHSILITWPQQDIHVEHLHLSGQSPTGFRTRLQIWSGPEFGTTWPWKCGLQKGNGWTGKFTHKMTILA